MQRYALDFYGFSNEDGDGCMAVFVDFPEIKGVGDTFEEAEADAYERLEHHLKSKEKMMQTSFEQGVGAYESKQFTDAYRYFEEASRQQQPQAMINLAVMHLQGKGCARDPEQAKALFEKAAGLGSTHAMMSLAQWFEKGLDGTPDDEKALAYYQQAADNGHVNAQLKTGILYREKGMNVQAMRYLITAAHNNNPQAQEIITYVSNKELCQTQNAPFRVLQPEQQKVLIERMIDEKIRPTLATDGGGIELVNFVDGETPQIWLTYLGACSGCHLGSTSTADMLLDHFETLIDKNVVLYLM